VGALFYSSSQFTVDSSQLITSKDNEQLKLIRKLQQKRQRDKLRLVVAEGEDLVNAALGAEFEPEVLLVAGQDVEPDLLDAVSTLGSGSRVIGVFHQRWSNPAGELSVYLHGVHDPGNVGTVMRSAHALADGPVVLGPDCADPWSPKAVRASMGSVFARPPAKAAFADLDGTTIALAQRSGAALADVEVDGPVVLCLGAERDGLPDAITAAADHVAHIPLRPDGPDSLNVAMAATVALYERARMARHA
jgi:TrmH family RNA methyltransferase